ncbi:MAG: sugar ABC transporter permease [Candidatus Omnitrophica bacterium]|nr:sugar ABC transporter permease [Candidatus Omnitrophota bacterium]
MIKLKSSDKEAVAGYLFVLPNFIGFAVFTLVPVILSLVLSFVNWDMLSPPKMVGLANFINLVGFHKEAAGFVANDPLFWKCLGNTLYLMLIIPVEIMASLVLALVVNHRIRGINLFKTIYFLPTITNGVAICLLWAWIYNSDFGLLNSIIIKCANFLSIHAHGIPWLTSVEWAKPSLMMMGLWIMMGGYNMILFLAALQGVPRELYEAAEIDGAGSWEKFWSITWPMISPTTFFITVMAVIGGFQGGFMQAYIMTGGGPDRSTMTLEYLIYNHLYSWQHVGYAACIAWFVFMIVFLVTIFNWRFGGKLVQYSHY